MRTTRATQIAQQGIPVRCLGSRKNSLGAVKKGAIGSRKGRPNCRRQEIMRGGAWRCVGGGGILFGMCITAPLQPLKRTGDRRSGIGRRDDIIVAIVIGAVVVRNIGTHGRAAQRRRLGIRAGLRVSLAADDGKDGRGSRRCSAGGENRRRCVVMEAVTQWGGKT